MILTLEDFVREFKEIRDKGWIKTHRSGPTGIGKTLEDLGIPENNAGEPDFGEYELKSTRRNSQSMLTMFTKSPEPSGSNTYLLNKYGYVSPNYGNDRKVLHSTLSAGRFTPIFETGQSLRIHCGVDRISIESRTEIENVFWTRDILKNTFNNKYRNKFVYVKADHRGKGQNEEFLFMEAYEVSGFDYGKMIDLLEAGKIFVDLRIGQYPDGRTHDHGTGFRIRENDHPLLFAKQIRLV